METFKDDSREGGSTVVLGGKVLVVDIDFVIEHGDPLNPILRVSSVKTSNALLSGNATSPTSTLTDAFLADSIEKYCIEMQKREQSRNLERASRLRNNVLDHLRYMVVLDGLANRKEYGGLRWFTDIDEICPTLNGLAKSESEVIASWVYSFLFFLTLNLMKFIQFLVHVEGSAGYFFAPFPFLAVTIPNHAFDLLSDLSFAAGLSFSRSEWNRSING